MVLRLKRRGLLVGGPPCNSWIFINAATHGRRKDNIFGNTNRKYVSDATAKLGTIIERVCATCMSCMLWTYYTPFILNIHSQGSPAALSYWGWLPLPEMLSSWGSNHLQVWWRTSHTCCSWLLLWHHYTGVRWACHIPSCCIIYTANLQWEVIVESQNPPQFICYECIRVQTKSHGGLRPPQHKADEDVWHSASASMTGTHCSKINMLAWHLRPSMANPETCACTIPGHTCSALNASCLRLTSDASTRTKRSRSSRLYAKPSIRPLEKPRCSLLWILAQTLFWAQLSIVHFANQHSSNLLVCHSGLLGHMCT